MGVEGEASGVHLAQLPPRPDPDPRPFLLLAAARLEQRDERLVLRNLRGRRRLGPRRRRRRVHHNEVLGPAQRRATRVVEHPTCPCSASGRPAAYALFQQRWAADNAAAETEAAEAAARAAAAAAAEQWAPRASCPSTRSRRTSRRTLPRAWTRSFCSVTALKARGQVHDYVAAKATRSARLSLALRVGAQRRYNVACQVSTSSSSSVPIGPKNLAHFVSLPVVT